MSVAAQDVVVGKPIRPHLAKAAKDPQEALDSMKGKPFLLETKFDGVEFAYRCGPSIACMCRS
jgi:ATP-dependent DNA ligase